MFICNIYLFLIYFFYKELGLVFLTENRESYFKVGNIDRSIIKIAKKREKKKEKEDALLLFF